MLNQHCLCCQHFWCGTMCRINVKSPFYHEPPTIHPSTSIHQHQRHVLPIVQEPKYSPGPFQCLVYTLQRYAGPSEKAKSAHTLFNDELFPRGQRRRDGLTSSKFWGVWNVYQKSREVKNVRFWFALYDSTLWWIGPRIMNLELRQILNFHLND